MLLSPQSATPESELPISHFQHRKHGTAKKTLDESTLFHLRSDAIVHSSQTESDIVKELIDASSDSYLT